MSCGEDSQTQELTAQEAYNFADLLADCAREKDPNEDVLVTFERLWPESIFADATGDPGTGGNTWHSHRGIAGDTPLHMVVSLKHSVVTDPSMEWHISASLCDELACQMVRAHPEIINIATNAKMINAGETALHRVVANSDLNIFQNMLSFLKVPSIPPDGMEKGATKCESAADSAGETVFALNARARGSFFGDIIKVPEHYGGLEVDGVTPLITGMIAPVQDRDALLMVANLLEAGADHKLYDINGHENGTVLHLIAQSRWGNVGQMGSTLDCGRMRALIELLLYGRCELLDGDQMPEPCQLSQSKLLGNYLEMPDKRGLTAMQVAARCGNDTALCGFLKKEVTCFITWGHKCIAYMPLDIIDCGQGQESSVIELLVLHKHKHMETMRVIHDVIQEKWERFGRFCVFLEGLVLTIIVMLVTVSSFGEGIASHQFKQSCRVAAPCVTIVHSSYLVWRLLVARRTAWFRSLAWFHNDFKLALFDVGPICNIAVMVISCAVVAVQALQSRRAEQGISTFTHMVIDGCVSLAIFLLWISLLRFMGLFETTGPVVQAIPIILKNDFLPWLIVYVTVLLACAGAIRIAVKHHDAQGNADDLILGNFWRVALTLEEATHGPDVQWREAVMHRPLMSGIFFLTFLWVVTVVLLNLLIAMFSDTFAQTRADSKKATLHAKAIEVISYEKLLPSFLHQRWIGDFGLPLHLRKYHRSSLRLGKKEEADEETPLLGQTRKRTMLEVPRTATKDIWAEHIDSVHEGEAD